MRALVNLLVPSLCDGCGVRARPPWCAACAAEARRLRPRDPCCRCAGPDVPDHACWPPRVPITATTALSTWTGPVARTVLHAKLAGRREVLWALGIQLASLVAVQPDAVVAVPTDPRRVRRRGLDHTRVLARAVAAGRGVPMVVALRTGMRVPDRGATAHDDRQHLPAGVFVPTRHAPALAGGSVLLVDDVVTTGATLAAAARVLARGGTRRCAVAVVARAGTHRLGD